jgi:hypothetical protein
LHHNLRKPTLHIEEVSRKPTAIVALTVEPPPMPPVRPSERAEPEFAAAVAEEVTVELVVSLLWYLKTRESICRTIVSVNQEFRARKDVHSNNFGLFRGLPDPNQSLHSTFDC